jgi:hypothetical protein
VTFTIGINQRKLGNTSCTVFPQTTAEVSYDFQPGIFMRVPVTHFDHVMDNGKVNPDIAGEKSKLPINFEDE